MAKKVYSLFVGRWQYFHKGHEALIRTALDEGRNVCIAIRDTEMSENNPYSVKQRKKMIKKAFKGERKNGRIRIITIPDIDEICYGRNVGYEIKEVKLGKELESISGTKIREKLRQKNGNYLYHRRLRGRKDNSR